MAFVLGAMYFGTRTDEGTAVQVLDRFVDAGGTMIDTSDNYSFWSHPSGFGGHSEALLGRWLAARRGMRDRVYLSTKVGAQPPTPGGYPDNLEGLSASAIKQAVRGSLERLGTERIDLYWAHVEDRSVPVEETMSAFGTLLSDGVVGRVGCSNWPTWRVELARQAAPGWPGFTVLQLMHSDLRPRPGIAVPYQPEQFGWVTDETLDYAASQGLEIWAYSPLLKGAYAHPGRLAEAYDHPGTTRRLAALDDVAASLGATRNQVVLAWLIGGDPAITPIVGVSTVTQLDEALAGGRLSLTTDQRPPSRRGRLTPRRGRSPRRAQAARAFGGGAAKSSGSRAAVGRLRPWPTWHRCRMRLVRYESIRRLDEVRPRPRRSAPAAGR